MMGEVVDSPYTVGVGFRRRLTRYERFEAIYDCLVDVELEIKHFGYQSHALLAINSAVVHLEYLNMRRDRSLMVRIKFVRNVLTANDGARKDNMINLLSESLDIVAEFMHGGECVSQVRK